MVTNDFETVTDMQTTHIQYTIQKFLTSSAQDTDYSVHLGPAYVSRYPTKGTSWYVRTDFDFPPEESLGYLN